jgi:FO synthase
MFGHCDAPAHWAAHLVALRDLQKRTSAVTEFVPLPFVHMEAPIYRRGRARPGPTLRECFLMHAGGLAGASAWRATLWCVMWCTARG